ncbi:furin-like isoform X2 [Mercenaria mercenaria]|nr:furin-like isoform X2 [Mercenaria mercenaria]
MSLTHKYQYIDIYSNSWAPFRDNNIEPLENILVEALQLTIKEGRNGKGTIYTFASGNDGPDDSCSADAYSSSMYTISIAAVTQAGSHVSYAEPCTAILAATFSGDDNFPYITTTGPNQTCIDDFDGTSAACPQASGIIALTLQANPELTWRDIQHMIVEFSNNTDLSHSTDDLEFYINGAGKQVSIWTGFGLMDAQAMVENAKIWPIVPPRIYCGSDDIFISRFETGAEFSEYFNVKNCLIKYLEHVQVHLEFSSSYRGDVEFLLVSPMGTKSLIYPTRPFDNYTYLTWGIFMSVHSWGEDPNGDWELIMNPVNSRMDLYLRSWALDLYGTATDPLAGIPPAGTFGSPCNGTASCTSVVNGGCLLDKEELCDNICVPCKDGYHFSGDFCEKDCPPLYFIDYGFVNVSRTLEGIYAIYSCEEGYAIIEGDVTRTCGSDSVWTGIQPTCEVDCGLLDDPANGAVFFLNTTYDYDANYTCHEGFSIRYGDETRICSEEGEWTGIKPTCSRVCRQPESPEYGHVYFINTFVDSKAIFTCNSGYTLTGGDAEIVCGSDGKWSSGEPVCLKDCCSLEPPANGNVNFISTTTWSIATYTCLTGYAVSSGNSLRTCSSYGIWTGTAPVCDIDCGPLDSPANGTVISSSTTKGSTATYSCLNGLTVKSGDVLRACASDGSWTGTKPVCGKGNTSSAPGSVNKNFVVETCVGILAVVFMFI